VTSGQKTLNFYVYCKYIAIIVFFIFPSILLAGQTTPMQAQMAVEGWLSLDPKPAPT
jgi:hypothetical protein